MLKNILGEFRVIKKWFDLRFKGYLYDEGWFDSIKRRKSIGRGAAPKIWMTYPFLDFFEERLGSEMSIFEYGCGNSTLYLESRVGRVFSVEHDKIWYESIKKKVTAKTELLFRSIEPQIDYVQCIKDVVELFDIVIVDGRYRNNCVEFSISFLKDEGVLILDDAERAEYQYARDYLKSKGFRKIEFRGIAPGIIYKKSTCVFYRNNNCLGI